MKTQVIVTQVNHYEMQDNRGLSVRIVGDYEESNNKFGLSISEAVVPDFGELRNLQNYKGSLPGKFEADLHFVTKKGANQKEITSVSLSNLKFLNQVELKDVVAK